MSFKMVKNVVAIAALCAAVPSFADGLPAGYTQVPFIKANGNCQVRTGLTPASTDKVEMTWRPTRTNVTENLWCSRTGSKSTSAQFTAFQISQAIRIDRNEGAAGQKTSAAALLTCTNYTIVADYAAGTCVVTNVAANEEVISVAMADTAAYTPGSELCLFGSHSTDPDTGYGNQATYRLYSFKLKDSAGTAKLDLVPAKRDADGVLGLYDLARSTFLTNCNTGVFTTQGIGTITPSDPLWGETLTFDETVIIDAGDGATWPGSVYVFDGGSLTTRGNLNIAGSTLFYPGSDVTIDTGTAYFVFSSDYIRGKLTVNAGATLRMNTTQPFYNYTTIEFHLYGTLDVASTRQCVFAGKYFFHDGSRVIGAGDAYCGLYAYKDSRIVFDGTVEIEPPVAVLNDKTFTAACCENAHVKFNGGFKAYTSSQKTGIFVQEAATAEEGNASETCANALIEVGPCSYGGAYNYTGSMAFVSPATVALANINDFTVTTSGASLELIADKATALANHTAVLPLPIINQDATSASLPTVRLTGDGVVSLRDSEPAFPIEFAGASLFTTNAPIALASGSSVTVATAVGVEGLAAETAATLFTDVDSSFDVSKVSVQTAHSGVLFGTAAAATLSGTDVVTAGVPAYDALGWIEPYIEANALIWLDASDAANFEFKDNTFGLVTTWRDRSSYKRDATAYTIASHDPNWGTLAVTNGVPAYCMGACDSGVDLSFAVRMTTIRTVFWAMSICQDSRAFFLGDSSSYHFHRGGGGQYCYNNNSAIWKNGKIYCDGVLVTDNLNTLVPTDRHVYSTVTAASCASNRLTLDRASGSSIRHAGRELSELIAFDTPLSDADREAIEAYLAAKWMGANPTAAGTDGTYAVSGEMEVDGTLGGGKNLDFAEGASVSVTNPSSTEPMLSTTGAVTLPSGTPLAVTVDASGLVPGTYTVIEAGSGITSLSQFTPTATVGDGATATFAVVDGKLTLTIAVTSSVASQTWRPASSADLGWNTTSANWLYDGGATGAFIPYVPAFIDGAEAATGDITVTGTQTAGAITLTGANDYTFKGDGTLAGGDTVTFGGTGTVTLDGPFFGDQTIVITNGQKVVLGFNASQNALGTDSGSSGGKVEIKDGGQLNINYTETASNTTSPRADITHHKTFAIAGDGPDGRGALINDALDGRGDLNPYGSQFRRIELTDDATVGGTHRMEVRSHTATSGTATSGIYGPGKHLTIKSTNPYGFGVVSQPVKVGAVTIVEGARLRPEAIAESQFDIPGGITLDGGSMDLYSSTFSTNVPFYVTANGGNFIAGSGATTIKGDVNVASGASLALTGDKNVTFNGAVNAVGAAITHSSSATTYFKGPSAGTLDITKSAGNVYLGSGFSNSVVNITQTGGNCGLYTEATAPIFETFNIATTGGETHFQPQSTSTMIDVPGTINISQPSGITYVYGPEGNKGMAAKMNGAVTKVVVGTTTSRPGFLHLKSGTDLTVSGDFSTGGNASKPSRGEIVIESGAKVKVTGRLINAYYAGEPDAVERHRMDIYGELDASTSGSSWVTMDAPRGEMYLHAGGVLKVKNLYATRSVNWYYGNGVAKNEGHDWFVMDGGRLEIGPGGFLGPRVPGITRFNLKNGEMVNASGAWGCAQGMPLVFGDDEPGGAVTFDMAGYYVNWNTGLSGASDVTIKGSANFQGNRAEDRLQGAMVGRLTVENTAGNDLRNASAFCGGLTLTNGVNAQVAKFSDDRYSYAIGTYRDGSTTRDDTARIGVTAWSYPYVSANFWNFIHKKYSSNPHASYTTTAGRGQFYVPAEKAGTWTFAGTYDDRLRLYIGTNLVFATSASSGISCGSIALEEGWHTFTIVAYDATGSCGPTPSGWTGVMSLGFRIGESTSTAAADYTKFEPGASLGDDLTLQVRPAVNACVWSYCATKPTATTFKTTEDWSHIKCIDTIAPMYKHSSASDVNDWKAYFSGKANKFEGWFKVEDDKAGEWTFKMAYDDYKMLKIDGVEKISNTSASAVPTATVSLAAGWHRWEVRVGDGSGNWGPRTYNNGNTLSYIAPGDTEKQFNETNLTLAATLGDIAVLEPTGIYKELELGAGSTLTSAGTMAMPIYGTLKGTGTLAGDFAFAGTTNCWEVTGAGARTTELPAATFANATAATFAGLKSVRVLFDAKPSRRAYYLTGAIDGLSATDLPAAAITVKDVTGGDYSANFTLAVKNGRLALSNSKPAGTMIIVR